MPAALGIKSSDGDSPVNLGGLIHCPLSGHVRITTFKVISEGGCYSVEDELCIPHHHAFHNILGQQWRSWFGYMK